MKKVSSAVWKFFERVIENGRCLAVLCKLCECQYKYFGNTTNLRVHLINKHPIQWELSESGSLNDTNFQIEGESSGTTNNTTAKRKYKTRGQRNLGYSVSVNNSAEALPKIEVERIDVDPHSDTDLDDDETTINLVRQMHGDQNSGEEWLEEDPYHITHIETFEPQSKKKRKYRKIKREVPSPTGLPGFYVAPKAEKVIYEDTHRKDEYSVFGEYVANKLRKVKLPRTRGNLQQLITTILWQAEYGLYDNADTVKRVLLMNLHSDTEAVEYDVLPNHSEAVAQDNEEITNKNINPDPNESGISESVLE